MSPTQGLSCFRMQRLCFTVAGSDAATYLHSQSSNDIATIGVGQSRYTFVLEPTGKIVALVRATRLSNDQFLLDADPVDGLREILLERLKRFKIRVDASIEVETREFVAVRSTDGDSIADAVRSGVATDGATLAVDAWWGDGRAVDLIPVGRDGLVDVESSARRLPGAVFEPADALERLRVRSGWPMMGREIVPGETLVATTGLSSIAVSFSKGCYPGQELVERMDSRGSSAPRVLRRFRRSDVDGAESLSAGDELAIGGEDIGIVTSAAGDWLIALVARGVEAGEVLSPPA